MNSMKSVMEWMSWGLYSRLSNVFTTSLQRLCNVFATSRYVRDYSNFLSELL